MNRIVFFYIVILLMISFLPSLIFSQQSEHQKQAIAKLKVVGGSFKQDMKLPGKPVVEATFSGLKSTFTANRFASIRHLTNLRTVWLGDLKIADIHLDPLMRLTKLEELYLIDTSVTDAGLEKIARIPSLRVLCIDGCTDITDRGFRKLAKLLKLENLWVQDMNQITDTGIQHLRFLPKLRTLLLPNTGITDRGVQLLCTFPALETVVLRGCMVSDKCLKSLSTAPKLRNVSFACEGVSLEGLNAVMKNNPRLKLTIDP